MMSGIQMMPTTGIIDPTLGETHWKSRFSHDDELAYPGYQRVYLKDIIRGWNILEQLGLVFLE